MGAEQADIHSYVQNCIQFDPVVGEPEKRLFIDRLERSFSALPQRILQLFLLRERKITIRIIADTGFPLGMHTTPLGDSTSRTYDIVMLREHQNWTEERFIGGFLRELGHVVCQKPPESEWPTNRGDRARFREQLEYDADTAVWLWGLRHYSMAYLRASFPPHWVERIVQRVSELMLERGNWF